MKAIHLGSRVRIADPEILDAALHDLAGLRPEPGQMAFAGREAIVTGYHRRAEDGPLYALRGAPGLWPEGWIDPV